MLDKRNALKKMMDANIPKHYWEYELTWYENKFKTLLPNEDREELLDYIHNPIPFVELKRHLWIYNEKEKSNQKQKAYKSSLAIQLGKSLLNKPI
jgi:hypothetical protein